MSELKPTQRDIEEATQFTYLPFDYNHLWPSVLNMCRRGRSEGYLAGVMAERKRGYEDKAKLQAENDKLRISAAGLVEALDEVLGLTFKAEHAWDDEDYNLRHDAQLKLEEYRKAIEESDTKGDI